MTPPAKTSSARNMDGISPTPPKNVRASTEEVRWNCAKSEDSKDTSKKELAALIQQSVRVELNKIDKKRKSDSDNEFNMAALEAELESFY